jgi:hypothetical protein
MKRVWSNYSWSVYESCIKRIWSASETRMMNRFICVSYSFIRVSDAFHIRFIRTTSFIHVSYVLRASYAFRTRFTRASYTLQMRFICGSNFKVAWIYVQFEQPNNKGLQTKIDPDNIPGVGVLVVLGLRLRSPTILKKLSSHNFFNLYCPFKRTALMKTPHHNPRQSLFFPDAYFFSWFPLSLSLFHSSPSPIQIYNWLLPK